MATDNKVRDAKIQYDIIREVAKYQHYHEVTLINLIFFTREEI